MTAAHNEETFIEGVLESVIAQTLLPRRWVIVSDNSTDRTDEIIESYAQKHHFIRLLHVTRVPGRNFAAKVLALRRAHKLIQDVEYDFIGNLDADVSLEPSYFQEIVRHFQRNPNLGLCAGYLYEHWSGKYQSTRINDTLNVFHAAQLVRRECYDALGGYAILKYGGEDWYAQTHARMLGWQVEALPQLKIYHHRHTTGGSDPLRNAFRLGRQDYSFGSDPFFEILKCLRRIPEKPYFGHALARFAGFIWPYICREPRAVPDHLAVFLRQEQRARVAQLLHRGRSAFATVITRVQRETKSDREKELAPSAQFSPESQRQE